MSKRRVLAISSNLDQLRRIVANLERAGAEVDAVRSIDAIQSEIIREEDIPAECQQVLGDQHSHRIMTMIDSDITIALSTSIPSAMIRAARDI